MISSLSSWCTLVESIQVLCLCLRQICWIDVVVRGRLLCVLLDPLRPQHFIWTDDLLKSGVLRIGVVMELGKFIYGLHENET